jgi:hypothetical protein
MDGALHFLTFERAEIATYPSTSWPQARAAAVLCSREFGRNGPAVVRSQVFAAITRVRRKRQVLYEYFTNLTGFRANV